MDNLFFKLLLVFLIFWFLLCIFMLINPKFFVNQTVFWNKWFLKLIGYEIEIKPKSNAILAIRFCAGLLLFVFLLVFSMVFDILMMVFR